MLKIYCGSDCIHDPTTDNLVWNISLTRKINEPGSLTFVIHDTHIFSNNIYPNCNEIRVDKITGSGISENVDSIFYGRVISTSINFRGERTITCEGELAYLYDSIPNPFLFTDKSNAEIIEHIIDEHNSQMGSAGIDKRIYLEKTYDSETGEWSYAGRFNMPYLAKNDVDRNGFIHGADGRLISLDAHRLSVWFEDSEINPSWVRRQNLATSLIGSSAYLEKPIFTWMSDGTLRSLDIIQQYLTEQFGGVLYITHENGRRELMYTQINNNVEPTPQNSPLVTIQDNLLDITYDKSAEERFNVIYPLGAEITQTDSLVVRSLKNKTWLAFGDASSVCRVTDTTVLTRAQSFDDINSGSVRLYLDADYTDAVRNAHTSNGKSYINLLTEGSGMRTITMCQDTETIFKHGGHKNGSATEQEWSKTGQISGNRDKSVVERLYDMFGAAKIDEETEKTTYIDKTKIEHDIETQVAVGMTLQSDLDNVKLAASLWQLRKEKIAKAIIETKAHNPDYEDYNIDPIRTADFVTVSVGLNDWLNADSILGTNKAGRKYSAYLDAAATTQAALFKHASTNAIEDYLEGGEQDEDGIRREFKKTLYWQIRFLCMYLKACFPVSHIIIFSSFGQKTKADKDEYDTDSATENEGTGQNNKVGRKGWYPEGADFDSATKRIYTDFYKETTVDPYMKQDTSGGEGSQPPNQEWSLNDEATVDDFNVIEAHSDLGPGTHIFEKVYINGDWSKSSKSSYIITDAGLKPTGESDAECYAFAKVTKKELEYSSGSGGSGSVPVLSGGDEVAMTESGGVPQPGDDEGGEIPDISDDEGGEGGDVDPPEPTEVSKPYVVWAKRWNTFDGQVTYDNISARGREWVPQPGTISTDTDTFENAPEIVCNPYDVLEENSYSISDLNSAINEVCDEFGITYVDSEQTAGISVNNFADIVGEIETIYDEQDEDGDGKGDAIIAQNITVTDMPYDNLGSKGTKKGSFGESFVKGAYLNDLGQLAMAKAVRNAMLECMTSSGEIENIERLTIVGNETPYFAPVVHFQNDGDENEPWRAMKMVPNRQTIKIAGIYAATERFTRKTSYPDEEGYGKHDLIDINGNYNQNALAEYNLNESGVMELDQDNTDELIPKPPSDPVVAVVQFDEIADPKELFKAGAQYLFENHGQNVINITVKAVDLHILDQTVPEMKIGYVVLVTAMNYGLHNSPFVVDTITESDDPADTIITLKSMGGSTMTGDILEANPYGAYNKRKATSAFINAFSNFSDIISAFIRGLYR